MKLRFWFGLAILGVLLIGSGNMALAFHSGGVAECGGCHSMHSPKAAGFSLLIGSDQSSTCLSCHEHAGDTGPSSYHISTAPANMPAGTAPLQRTPGGDFGWLKKTYNFLVRGTPTIEDGQTHGHNIVAVDSGYAAQPGDASHNTSPGGTFPNSQLGCQSCHDPHGKNRRLSDGSYVKGGTVGAATAPIVASGSYNSASSVTVPAGQAVGTYRLLRGLGDTSQGQTFTGVAIAVAPSTYNQTEATNQVRVAYGATGINTWGNWCATCHGSMHSSGNYVHPIDQSLGSLITNNYNAYVKSGDLTGTSATSFTSLVPFMENTGDIATLASHASNANGFLNGPGTSDKVACLSCHRAHASGFPDMLRWNMENEFIVKNGVYQESERGRTTLAEQVAGYYDRPASQFAIYQRGLCNKCHAQD
jgi:predicted CXXCH cytochrome family protein